MEGLFETLAAIEAFGKPMSVRASKAASAAYAIAAAGGSITAVSPASSFGSIGVVMSLFGIMARFSIGGYPLGDTLALTLHDLVAWIVAGIVIARLVRPVPQENVTMK